MLVLDHTYEFTIGMTILYLTYQTYDQMDLLLNPLQQFKVMYITCNLFDGYVYSKTFSLCRSYSWIVSPNYLETKKIKVSVCIGCFFLQVVISEYELISHAFNFIFLLPGFAFNHLVLAMIFYYCHSDLVCSRIIVYSITYVKFCSGLS